MGDGPVKRARLAAINILSDLDAKPIAGHFSSPQPALRLTPKGQKRGSDRCFQVGSLGSVSGQEIGG